MAWYKKAYKKINKGVKSASKTIKKVESVGKKVVNAPVIGGLIKQGWEDAKRSDPRIAAASKAGKELGKVADAGAKGGVSGIAKQQYNQRGRSYLQSRGVDTNRLEGAVSAYRSGTLKDYAMKEGEQYIRSKQPEIEARMSRAAVRAAERAMSTPTGQRVVRTVSNLQPMLSSTVLNESTSVTPTSTMAEPVETAMNKVSDSVKKMAFPFNIRRR